MSTSLAELFDRLEPLLADLENAMTEIRGAMAENEPERVQKESERLQALLASLDHLEGERLRMVRAEGGEPAEMTAFVEGLGDTPLQQRWRSIHERLGRIAELNSGNAELARRGARTAQNTLRILTGGPGDGDTYDNHGTTGPAQGRRSIARA